MLLDTVHRRGLEEQVLELRSLCRRSNIDLTEAREELQRAQLRIRGLEEAQAVSQAKLATLDSVQEYSMELQSRLKFSEAEIQVKRKESATVNDRLAGAKRQLEEALHREDRQIQISLELESELATAHMSIRHLEQAKERQDSELAASFEELKRVKEQLQEKNLLVEALERDKIDLRLEAQDTGAQLQEAQSSLAATSQTVQELEHQVGDLNRADRRELATRADLETLRGDNARMLKLLRSTKEYAQFQQLWEDAQGASYLPGASSGEFQTCSPRTATVSPSARSTAGLVSPLSFREEGTATTFRRSMSSTQIGKTPRPSDQELEWANLEVLSARYAPNLDPLDVLKEADSWVPAAVMKLANDFYTHHAPEVPIGLMQDFIRKLNQIWRSREVHHVERLRVKFKDQLDQTTRRANGDKSYEAVMAEWSIRRLKKEVREARGQLLKGRPKSAGGRGGIPTPRSAQKRTATPLTSDEELGVSILLEDEVTGFGSQPFMAGAAWFGKSAVFVADSVAEDIEDLRLETTERLKTLSAHSTAHSTAERAMLLEQLQRHFLQDLDQRVSARRRQMRQVYDSVLDHRADDIRGFFRLDSKMPRAPDM